MRAACSVSPMLASQRGLSGRPRRIVHTAKAPVAPMSMTQRHPSSPNGARGTSSQARNATVGTEEYVITWLSAKARPLTCGGTSSLR